MSFTSDFRAEINWNAVFATTEQVQAKAGTFLDEVATEMVNDIKASYTASPSIPGEPPGVVTGNLRSGTMYWPGDEDLERLVGVQAEYGPPLEFGTRRGLEPRPFIGPVFQNWRGRFAQEAERYNWS